MAKFNWRAVTEEDVVKAIEIFDAENPEHPEPKSTFLLYSGKKYPAKHIRGMAYKVHFGVEISKEDYTGGQETVRFFDSLGFETQYTHKSVNTHPVKTAKVKAVPVPGPKPKDSPSKKEETGKSVEHRVTIPVKGVIEQKSALQLLLNKLCNGDVVCEKTYPWMKTPAEITDEYKPLYEALSEYRGNVGFAKKNVVLRCDFVCEGRKLIIEYDERQHFSEARRISLLAYQNVPVHFDRQLWIDACQDIQARDNQPRDRDEVRAFYDSTRDIEAAKHGYSLVRIMHGQIDFEQDGAKEQLEELLGLVGDGEGENIPKKKEPLKIGLYLQTNELYGNDKVFGEAMDVVRKSDIDILVLPEFSYVPFSKEYTDADFLDSASVQSLCDMALELSSNIGRAIVVCNEDKYGTIMSIYANAFASDGETDYKDYIKHTMTAFSACQINNYSEYAKEAFQPIIYKGYRIGLTICYDCNHAMFSRKYSQNGVDIILNSTGGNVVFDKWHKYNKARAIENTCFTFVTMGGPGDRDNPHNYVYGFTPQGKEMHPVLLNGRDDGRRNFSGGIYVYDTSEDDGKPEVDSSIKQLESVNKKNDIYIPSDGIDELLSKSRKISDYLYVLKKKEMNLVICQVNGEDIIKPEKVLKLLYSRELRGLNDKRYLIVNRWGTVDMDFYNAKLSVILKVRAMENYCAVLLLADNIRKAFQCGKNRTAQVIKEENGKFGIDLSRTGGPETIWRDKQGMKAEWRKNIEWLIESM